MGWALPLGQPGRRPRPATTCLFSPPRHCRRLLTIWRRRSRKPRAPGCACRTPPVLRWPGRSRVARPAGLFISADLDWMNYLADRKLVRTESRVNLLGNRLVLVGHEGHSGLAQDRTGVRTRPGARPRTARARGSGGGAGRQIRPRGFDETRRLGCRREQDRRGGECPRRAAARLARRGAARHRLPHGRHGRRGRRRGRHISGVVAHANHLSRGIDGDGIIGGLERYWTT